MTLARSIREYESVKTWERGLRDQWGGDPLSEDPDKLEALEAFCEFIGEDPDQIIERSFRIRKSDGERVLSVKWRRHYAEKVKEFRGSRGERGRQDGAAVLGFMIHNGVLIQA